MFDVDRLLRDMETKGFCVLERLFDEKECAEMEQLLIDGVGGLDALGDSGGRVLHPLLSSRGPGYGQVLHEARIPGGDGGDLPR